MKKISWGRADAVVAEGSALADVVRHAAVRAVVSPMETLLLEALVELAGRVGRLEGLGEVAVQPAADPVADARAVLAAFGLSVEEAEDWYDDEECHRGKTDVAWCRAHRCRECEAMVKEAAGVVRRAGEVDDARALLAKFHLPEDATVETIDAWWETYDCELQTADGDWCDGKTCVECREALMAAVRTVQGVVPAPAAVPDPEVVRLRSLLSEARDAMRPRVEVYVQGYRLCKLCGDANKGHADGCLIRRLAREVDPSAESEASDA